MATEGLNIYHGGKGLKKHPRSVQQISTESRVTMPHVGMRMSSPVQAERERRRSAG